MLERLIDMLDRLLAVFGWMNENSRGKTFFVTWILGEFAAFSLHGPMGALTQWFLFIFAYQLQAMVNRAYHPHPQQQWLNQVNDDRKNRIHQEEIALHLMARGMNPERAKDVSHLTVDVLGIAGYSLPAAA